MLNRTKKLLSRSRSLQKVNFSIARGAAASSLRTIDLRNPGTWEFSGFSQNGEDGLLDVLLKQVKEANRYFIEIGTADGLENNSSWLSIVQKYCGLCIEGNPQKSNAHQDIFTPLNYGLSFLNLFVTNKSIETVKNAALTLTPDVFSLDIDGNDYHIGKVILESGFRPKIFVVEYNSAFGPETSVSIPYAENFQIGSSEADRLYYGCSLAAWKTLFKQHGYRFLTVDRNGVNGFFVDPTCFHGPFLDQVEGLQFAENFSQFRIHKADWKSQFDAIADRPLFEVKA